MANESIATETTTEKKRPGANRNDEATIAERVNKLYEMRSHGHTRQSAWRYASSSTGWGISERTFDRYWARTTELLKQTWSVDREQIFHECLDGLKSAHVMAMEQRNPSAAQACITSIARLSAVDPSVPWSRLYEPKKNGL